MEILRTKAMEIRDINKGENPVLYSSGHWGPGYVSIKNLVGRKDIIKHLSCELAKKVTENYPHLDFVAGVATGGIIIGWLLSEYLELLLRKQVPFVYIRKKRKQSGQKELITGIIN